MSRMPSSSSRMPSSSSPPSRKSLPSGKSPPSGGVSRSLGEPKKRCQTRKVVTNTILITLLVLMYLHLIWMFVYIGIGIYSLSRRVNYENLLLRCFYKDPSDGEVHKFSQHHMFRIICQTTYGVSGVLASIFYTQVSEYGAIEVTLLVIVLTVLVSTCIAGMVESFVWPLNPAAHLPLCRVNTFLLWLYASWPSYIMTLVLLAMVMAIRLSLMIYVRRAKKTKAQQPTRVQSSVGR